MSEVDGAGSKSGRPPEEGNEGKDGSSSTTATPIPSVYTRHSGPTDRVYYTNTGVAIAPLAKTGQALVASLVVVYGTVVLAVIRGDVGYVEALLTLGFEVDEPDVLSLVTHPFIHSSFNHMLTNAMFLYYLLQRLKPHLQSERLLAGLFLVYAIISALAQAVLLAVLGSPGVMVGASGGVFGLLGLYATLRPRNRFLAIIPLSVAAITVSLAAITVYFIFQFGLIGGGMGHIAHLVGLAGGVLTGLFVQGQME